MVENRTTRRKLIIDRNREGCEVTIIRYNGSYVINMRKVIWPLDRILTWPVLAKAIRTDHLGTTAWTVVVPNA